MDIYIRTEDPDSVDPAFIAGTLEEAGFYVFLVNINDGERVWEDGDPTKALP